MELYDLIKIDSDNWSIITELTSYTDGHYKITAKDLKRHIMDSRLISYDGRYMTIYNLMKLVEEECDLAINSWKEQNKI